MTIKITAREVRNIPFTSFTFSGGEEHIKFNPKDLIVPTSYTIHAALTSSAEIVRLMIVTDALRRAAPDAKVNLNMPYIPYARQDRVCNAGEALGIRVFCELINSMKFDRVKVLMPHSDVSLALLNNADETMHEDRWDNFVASKMEGVYNNKDLVIVSPDAGAMKRTLSFAQFYNAEYLNENEDPVPVVMADKVRDVTNGKITHTTVHVSQTGNELEGKTCLIYDDICDGGMTFIKLAEELRFHGAKKVILAVPHGIFSKGLTEIAKNIDHVITTNVFAENIPEYRSITVDVLEVV